MEIDMSAGFKWIPTAKVSYGDDILGGIGKYVSILTYSNLTFGAFSQNLKKIHLFVHTLVANSLNKHNPSFFASQGNNNLSEGVSQKFSFLSP